MNEKMEEKQMAVLRAAYRAWMNGQRLRQSRLRCKRFTYGDQWGDIVMHEGCPMTEGEEAALDDRRYITNNLIRRLVKTLVGRYRAQEAERTPKERDGVVAQVAEANMLDELDARALEEFLISGCCIQRVEDTHYRHAGVATGTDISVDNVNLNRFFVNALSDPRAKDCELCGQLHDLSVAELLRRTAGGSRRNAERIRRLYEGLTDEGVRACAAMLGADNASGMDFWQTADGTKCRAIEVWTLESREVLVCEDLELGTVSIEPVRLHKTLRANKKLRVNWEIATLWHCRWFSPMGDVLTEYDSPWQHGSHPFAMKFYPLTDGEVHSMVEDVIDQQKYVNRLITLVDHVIGDSAKGVLLYPETALPDGYTWETVRKMWRSSNGLVPYDPQRSDARPQQIAMNNTNIGAYEMIKLQMQLLEEISGVSGALQGKTATGTGATLYATEADNANIAMTDIYATFRGFIATRNALIVSVRS